MSIKLYHAWRCKPRIFSEVFLPAFRKHCFNNAIQRVDNVATGKLFTYLGNPIVTETFLWAIYAKKGWSKKCVFEEFCKYKELSIRVTEALKRSIEASTEDNSNIFNIDCSLNIWLYKGNSYIVPYGEKWIIGEFEIPKEVQDYSYWNNTDKPDDISTRQWTEREKKWTEILDSWDTRLVHTIVDARKRIGIPEIVNSLLPEEEASIITIGI